MQSIIQASRPIPCHPTRRKRVQWEKSDRFTVFNTDPSMGKVFVMLSFHGFLQMIVYHHSTNPLSNATEAIIPTTARTVESLNSTTITSLEKVSGKSSNALL